MDSTALFKISSGLYVTGVKNGESFGGSVVDALVQATSSNPPNIIFCSMNTNNTTALIKNSGEFTVSVLSHDVDPFVIANFGYQSSRMVDKWVNIQHEIKDGLPVLSEAVAYYRCRVDDIRIMSTHNIFTSVVEDAWLGSGEPLLYSDYFKSLKNAAVAAFSKFKENVHTYPENTISDSAQLKPVIKTESKTSHWVCTVCGYVYNGDVLFDELPDDWTCPLCGASKALFEKQWI